MGNVKIKGHPSIERMTSEVSPFCFGGVLMSRLEGDVISRKSVFVRQLTCFGRDRFSQPACDDTF